MWWIFKVPLSYWAQGSCRVPELIDEGNEKEILEQPYTYNELAKKHDLVGSAAEVMRLVEPQGQKHTSICLCLKLHQLVL